MRRRFRVILPVVFGLIAVSLMTWDLRYQRALESVFTASDIGRPVWPCQAPSLLLVALNAPVFALAAPILNLFHLEIPELRYLVLLPAVLLWWWWLGTRIDFGILGRRHYRHPKLLAGFLAMVAVALCYGGIRGLVDAVSWWQAYGRHEFPTSLWLLAESTGASPWCLALAGGCVLAAVRLHQQRFPATGPTNAKPAMLALAVALIWFVAVGILLVRHRGRTRDPDSCVTNQHTGCIHGTIADPIGKPLQSIRVELLPAENSGDARRYSRLPEWTDNAGRYSFDQLEPGRYLVAVHYNDAPDSAEPLATALYPGVETESGAERIAVNAASRVMLGQLRLRSLSLATISVEVVWPDGSRPKRSNLLFHNLSYPHQAVIGDVAPEVLDGRGAIRLPEGFDYYARAKVDCDAGTTIESRESRPVQQIKVGGGVTPQKLVFTIPGPPCKLWVPE